MNRFFCYALFTLAGVAIGAAITYSGTPTLKKDYAFRLTEPLLIATASGEPHYRLPASTVLFHQQSFAEGHGLYVIEVLSKGAVIGERLSADEFAEPLWLYRQDTQD